MTAPKATPPDCPGLDGCEAAKPIHEQLAELRDGQTRLEAGQRMLASGHVQVVEQVAEITIKLDRHERQLADLSALPAAVLENTTLTRETLQSARETRELVKLAQDVQAAGRLGARLGRGIMRISRVGSKLVLWVAPAVGAAVAAWVAIKGGVPPPKP